MKKINLVTIAMFLSCVKAYGLPIDEMQQSLKRGVFRVIRENIEKILDCDQPKTFGISPLKNNGKNSKKGYFAYLSVTPNDDIYKMTVKFNNKEKFSAAPDRMTLEKLKEEKNSDFTHDSKLIKFSQNK